MDSCQESNEHLGQSTSIMWSEEDSAVTHGLLPVRSEHVSLSKAVKATNCKDPLNKKIRASENWQLLLRKLNETKASLPMEEPSSKTIIGNTVQESKSPLDTELPELKEPSSKERAVNHWRRMCSEINKREREAAAEKEEASQALCCKPSNKSLKYKRSKDLGSDRVPSTSSGSTSSKVVSDLKRESFSLPPQQSCVLREEPPKFAQGIVKDGDWCCSGEQEVHKNSQGLNQDTNSSQQQNGLISVDISPDSSSSFTEAKRRNTSQIKRRRTTSTDEVSTTATKSKKSLSLSSGSAGQHFPNFRQRQQELHRYRVLIEQRRLDLLELRIAREREEAKQYMILFQKKMQIKECKIRANEAYDRSNV
ncbi:hypothetical protein KR200_006995 [Drosophila serrata]|nr:hypothetical protein KR200_006995 [Drosophila serrata]